MIYLISLTALIVAYLWGGHQALIAATLLSVMEISLSFDNAVVNASVLKNMSKKWQKAFLSWGILIAVFGMRLIFPIVIVAFASNSGLIDILKMAINTPEIYKENLIKSHYQISCFGGVFLVMVFLNFFCDNEKDIHWFSFEKYIASFGKLSFYRLVIILLLVSLLGWAAKVGFLTYISIKYFSDKFSNIENVTRSGLHSFIYLEILDASFSLDGVIGAFALSNDIFIIMTGLGIGALFIRSMTVKLVRDKTLNKYIYLEHGAHYGIGALGVIMLLSTKIHIPELISGLIGMGLVTASFVASLIKKQNLDIPDLYSK